MKRCPVCNEIAEENYQFCRIDGTALEPLGGDALQTEPITEPIENSGEMRPTREMVAPMLPPSSDEESLLLVQRQFEARNSFTETDVHQSVSEVKAAIEELVTKKPIYTQLGIHTERCGMSQLCVEHSARRMFVYGDQHVATGGQPIYLHGPIFRKPAENDPIDDQYFVPIGRWVDGGVVLRWRYPQEGVNTYMDPVEMADCLLHSFRNSIRSFYADGR